MGKGQEGRKWHSQMIPPDSFDVLTRMPFFAYHLKHNLIQPEYNSFVTGEIPKPTLIIIIITFIPLNKKTYIAVHNKTLTKKKLQYKMHI